jgi:predicted ferric reductase
MVKSNLDHLGVVGLLDIQATTFILGVRIHVVEEMVENLDFAMEIHKNPVTRGVKNSNKWL